MSFHLLKQLIQCDLRVVFTLNLLSRESLDYILCWCLDLLLGILDRIDRLSLTSRSELIFCYRLLSVVGRCRCDFAKNVLGILLSLARMQV